MIAVSSHGPMHVCFTLWHQHEGIKLTKLRSSCRAVGGCGCVFSSVGATLCCQFIRETATVASTSASHICLRCCMESRHVVSGAMNLCPERSPALQFSMSHSELSSSFLVVWMKECAVSASALHTLEEDGDADTPFVFG